MALRYWVPFYMALFVASDVLSQNKQTMAVTPFDPKGITLPSAPNVKETWPHEDLSLLICFDMDGFGRLQIANNGITLEILERILSKDVQESGKVAPIAFRADVTTSFSNVWSMVSCAQRRGLFRLSFAAREGKVVQFFLEEQVGTGSSYSELKVDGGHLTFNGKAIQGRALPQPPPTDAGIVYFPPVLVRVSAATTYGELFAAFDTLNVVGYRTVVMASPPWCNGASGSDSMKGRTSGKTQP